jgi:hypothetical protein
MGRFRLGLAGSAGLGLAGSVGLGLAGGLGQAARIVWGRESIGGCSPVRAHNAVGVPADGYVARLAAGRGQAKL